jgi:hypothetical protein
MRPPQLITSPQMSHANHTHTTNGHMLTDPTIQQMQMQMQTRGQFLVPPVVGEQRESLLYASPSPFSPQPLPQPQPQQQQSTQPLGLPQPPAPPLLSPQTNPMRSDSLDALQQLQQPRQHHSQSAGIIRGPTTGAPLPPLLSPQQLQQLSQQQLYRQQQQQQPQQQQQQQQDYHREGRGSSPPPVPIQQGSPPPLVVVESLPRMHVGHGVSNALLDMIGEQLVGEREPAAAAMYHQQLLQPNPAVVAATGMTKQQQQVPLPHSHSYRAPTGHTPVPLSSPSMDVRDVALDFTTTAAAGAVAAASSPPPRAAATTFQQQQQQQQ